MLISYAVVTCEINIFQNYFSLRRRPSEITLLQCVETCLKLFHKLIQSINQDKSYTAPSVATKKLFVGMLEEYLYGKG